MEEQKCITVSDWIFSNTWRRSKKPCPHDCSGMFQPGLLWRQNGAELGSLKYESQILVMVSWWIIHVDLHEGPDGTALHSVSWLLSSVESQVGDSRLFANSFPCLFPLVKNNPVTTLNREKFLHTSLLWCVCDVFMQFISAWPYFGFPGQKQQGITTKGPFYKGFIGYNRRMPWASSTPPTPTSCTNPFFFPNGKSCLTRAVGITCLWAWAGWYFGKGHGRAGCSSVGVQALALGDVSDLCNFARTLLCYTAALWPSKNKWVTYPTAKDRQ